MPRMVDEPNEEPGEALGGEEVPPSTRRRRTPKAALDAPEGRDLDRSLNDVEGEDEGARAFAPATIKAPEPETLVRCAAEKRGPIAFVREMIAALGRARTASTAAEMAFWLFLSLLPLAAVAGYAAARLAVANRDAVSPLLETLPQGARELLSNELSRVSAWNGGTVGIIAAATFLWVASSGMHAIFDGLERQTESSSERSWLKKRALSIGACIALSIGIALIGFFSAGLDTIMKVAQGSVPWGNSEAGNFVSKVIQRAFAFAVAVGLVGGIYAVGIPAPVRRKMPLWSGAVLAVVLQAVLGFAYGLYISKMGDGGAYQAGLATIGVTMITLLLASLSLLIGAEFNQTLAKRRHDRMRGATLKE